MPKRSCLETRYVTPFGPFVREMFYLVILNLPLLRIPAGRGWGAAAHPPSLESVITSGKCSPWGAWCSRWLCREQWPGQLGQPGNPSFAAGLQDVPSSYFLFVLPLAQQFSSHCGTLFCLSPVEWGQPALWKLQHLLPLQPGHGGAVPEGRGAASSTPGCPPQAPQKSSPGKSQGWAGLAGPPEAVRPGAGHHKPALGSLWGDGFVGEQLDTD